MIVCDKYVNFNAVLCRHLAERGVQSVILVLLNSLRDAFRIVNSFTCNTLPTSAVLLVHEFQAALDILFRNNAYGHSTQ